MIGLLVDLRVERLNNSRFTRGIRRMLSMRPPAPSTYARRDATNQMVVGLAPRGAAPRAPASSTAFTSSVRRDRPFSAAKVVDAFRRDVVTARMYSLRAPSRWLGDGSGTTRASSRRKIARCGRARSRRLGRRGIDIRDDLRAGDHCRRDGIQVGWRTTKHVPRSIRRSSPRM
jgi:hypothetical protein